MNRAERRRNEKAKTKNPVYNIKSSDISRIKDDAVSEAVRQSTILMLSIPVMVLRDKYGFGSKRLDAFMEYTIDLFDSFVKEYITLEDLINTVKEETGVDIVQNGNNYRIKK